MNFCGECKYWHVDAQFRYTEGYWYCEVKKEYKVDPFGAACQVFERKDMSLYHKKPKKTEDNVNTL